MKKFFIALCLVFAANTNIAAKIMEISDQAAIPQPQSQTQTDTPKIQNMSAEDLQKFLEERVKSTVIEDSKNVTTGSINSVRSPEAQKALQEQNKPEFQKIYEAALAKIAQRKSPQDIRQTQSIPQIEDQQKIWEKPNFAVIEAILPDSPEKVLIPAKEHIPYLLTKIDKISNGSLADRMDKAVEIMTKELKKLDWLYDLDEESEFIGIGEVFNSLGKLSRKSSHYPLDVAHNYEITQESFQNVYNLIRGLDLDKAKKLKGISEKRADIIAIGLAIIKSAYNEFVRGGVKLSTNGEMYGIVAKNLLGQTGEKPLLDILGYSLSSINEFYPTTANADSNYALAVILYKQLKVLHKLTRPYVKVLRIAASLCMAGKRISFENYQKNNFAVILHSPIYGASHKDIVLAAFVAASQNIDDFSLSDWVRYKDLVSDEDLDAVRKLAVIIKMATMFNITNSNSVKDIACDVLGDTVILKTEVERDATLEISQAMSVAGDFKKVYGKNLQIL